MYCLNINSGNISNEINKWVVLVFSEPQKTRKKMKNYDHNTCKLLVTI